MRTCTKCNIEKDESEFYKHKSGLTSKCKGCVKKYNKSHFQVFKLTENYEKQKIRQRVKVRKVILRAHNSLMAKNKWIQLLQSEYIKKKKSCITIGQENGIGQTAILRALHRYGFKVRGSAETQRGVRKKGKHKTVASQLIRTSTEYKEWRLAVYKRDSFKCVGCGDNRGGNLQAHHILNFATYPKERFNISNGVTLCRKCHGEVHPKLKFVGNGA